MSFFGGFQWGWDKRMPRTVGGGGLIVLAVFAIPLTLFILAFVFCWLCIFAGEILEFVATLIRNDGPPSYEGATAVFVLLAISACFFTSHAMKRWNKLDARRRVYAIVESGVSVVLSLALIVYLARYPVFASWLLWSTWSREDWYLVIAASVVLIAAAVAGVGIGVYHEHLHKCRQHRLHEEPFVWDAVEENAGEGGKQQ
jgi:hypothetical protein